MVRFGTAYIKEECIHQLYLSHLHGRPIPRSGLRYMSKQKDIKKNVLL